MDETGDDALMEFEMMQERAMPKADRQTPLQRTSGKIGETLKDIQAGKTGGEYPALEKIISRSGPRHFDVYIPPEHDEEKDTATQEDDIAPEPAAAAASPPAAFDIRVTVHTGAFTMSLLALCFSLLTAMMVIYANLIK